MKPVANLGPPGANSPKTCDITVGDILGPLKEEAGTAGKNKEKKGEEAGDAADSRDVSDRERDTNFSLLSYSFSLVGPGSL